MRLALLFLPLMLSSCSLLIGNQGVDAGKAFAYGNPVSSASRYFGAPVQDHRMDPPRPLRDLALTEPVPPAVSSRLVAGYRDYRYQGRIKNPQDFAAYGMVSGLTLGMGELFIYSDLVRESKRLQNEVHLFRAYYDPSFKVIHYSHQLE